jgi:hypothetical protein
VLSFDNILSCCFCLKQSLHFATNQGPLAGFIKPVAISQKHTMTMYRDMSSTTATCLLLCVLSLPYWSNGFMIQPQQRSLLQSPSTVKQLNNLQPTTIFALQMSSGGGDEAPAAAPKRKRKRKEKKPVKAAAPAVVVEADDADGEDAKEPAPPPVVEVVAPAVVEAEEEEPAPPVVEAAAPAVVEAEEEEQAPEVVEAAAPAVVEVEAEEEEPAPPPPVEAAAPAVVEEEEPAPPPPVEAAAPAVVEAEEEEPPVEAAAPAVVEEPPPPPPLELKPREYTPVTLQVRDVRDIVDGFSPTNPRPPVIPEPSNNPFEKLSNPFAKKASSSSAVSTITKPSFANMDDSLKQLLEDARLMKEEQDDDDDEEPSDAANIKATVAKALSTIVTADFFLVLAFLLWFLAGIFCSSILKDDTVQIAFNSESIIISVLTMLVQPST